MPRCTLGVQRGGAKSLSAFDELWPVVLLRLERFHRLAFSALLAPLLLARRPLGQAGAGHGAVLGHLFFVRQLGRPVQTDAARVKEIDAVSDVVDPQRRVRRGLCLHVVAQVEEGDERTALEANAEARVGAAFARSWPVV